MSIFTRPPKIAHPNRMPEATRRLGAMLRLHREGRIPGSVEVALLVVPTKYMLRSIYGSNLRAALALLWAALAEYPERIRGALWRFWHYRVLMQSQERRLNEMMAEDQPPEDGQR